MHKNETNTNLNKVCFIHNKLKKSVEYSENFLPHKYCDNFKY